MSISVECNYQNFGQMHCVDDSKNTDFPDLVGDNIHTLGFKQVYFHKNTKFSGTLKKFQFLTGYVHSNTYI